MKATHRFLVLSLILAMLPVGAQAASGQWEEISNEDGIQVWKKEIEDNPVVAFKGETVIDSTISKVMTVLMDTSRKKEWVARIEEARDIRQISDFERNEYNHTGTPWPLQDRDFVFHAKVSFDKAKKQALIQLRSVEDPEVPKRSGIVRGQLHASSYTLTVEEGGKKTRIVVEIHTDPMGDVPKWIVNLFQKSWPRKTLEGIRAQAAKPDVKEHAGVRSILGPAS